MRNNLYTKDSGLCTNAGIARYAGLKPGRRGFSADQLKTGSRIQSASFLMMALGITNGPFFLCALAYYPKKDLPLVKRRRNTEENQTRKQNGPTAGSTRARRQLNTRRADGRNKNWTKILLFSEYSGLCLFILPVYKMEDMGIHGTYLCK